MFRFVPSSVLTDAARPPEPLFFWSAFVGGDGFAPPTAVQVFAGPHRKIKVSSVSTYSSPGLQLTGRLAARPEVTRTPGALKAIQLLFVGPQVNICGEVVFQNKLPLLMLQCDGLTGPLDTSV